MLPRAMKASAGLTAMAVTTAGVTVTWVLASTAPRLALRVRWPGATACTWPPAETVATAVSEELQVTSELRLCVLPSVKVPVAVICCDRPAASDGFAGVSASETSVASVTCTWASAVMDA